LAPGGPKFLCEKDQGGVIFANDPFNDISILKTDDVTLNETPLAMIVHQILATDICPQCSGLVY
jgi:hypothetical protein